MRQSFHAVLSMRNYGREVLAHTPLLLAVLAVVGIIMAPLTAPAVGGTMSAAATMAMAEDMPCCPHEKPVMPDCAKACPLMALCMAKCFQNLPTATALTVPLVATGRIVPSDEAQWG